VRLRDDERRREQAKVGDAQLGLDLRKPALGFAGVRLGGRDRIRVNSLS